MTTLLNKILYIQSFEFVFILLNQDLQDLVFQNEICTHHCPILSIIRRYSRIARRTPLQIKCCAPQRKSQAVQRTRRLRFAGSRHSRTHPHLKFAPIDPTFIFIDVILYVILNILMFINHVPIFLTSKALSPKIPDNIIFILLISCK